MDNAGDVIAQLLQVRAAIQTAMGLTNNAQNELRDARTRAGEVTQGTGNPNALDGLAAWMKADAGAGELTAKLAKVDDDIAGYIDMIRTGHSGGTQSTLIASLTGEEILRRSEGGGGKLNAFLRKATTGAGDVKDLFDKPVELAGNVVKAMKEGRDPGSVAETHTSTAPPSPLDPPPPDHGDTVAAVGLMAVVGVQAARMSMQRIGKLMKKERDSGRS